MADQGKVVLPDEAAYRKIKEFVARCVAPRKGSQVRKAVPVLGR